MIHYQDINYFQNNLGFESAREIVALYIIRHYEGQGLLFRIWNERRITRICAQYPMALYLSRH